MIGECDKLGKTIVYIFYLVVDLQENITLHFKKLSFISFYEQNSKPNVPSF